jgi:hypothetical protein
LISNFLIIYFFYAETKNLSIEGVRQMFDRSAAKHNVVDEEMTEEKAKPTEEAIEVSKQKSGFLFC